MSSGASFTAAAKPPLALAGTDNQSPSGSSNIRHATSGLHMRGNVKTDSKRATPADHDLDPGFFDSDAQQSADWLAWSDQAAIDDRLESLFGETLPRLEAVRGSDGRPSLDDRFSVAAFDWVVSLIDVAVQDEDGHYAAENSDLAEQFITYVGEWMVRRIEGVWFNSPGNGVPILDGFGPAIGYRWSQESANDLLVPLFMMAVEADDAPYAYFVDLLYGRALEFTEERDRPDLKAELLS
ncbi:hypothetical protein [Nocardia sp. CA-145437]|uniref:hypothetical protein n=1 Tax=Nocardia sp. CA-145437 TaxID=3239980 RepID=UPI003D952A54